MPLLGLRRGRRPDGVDVLSGMVLAGVTGREREDWKGHGRERRAEDEVVMLRVWARGLGTLWLC